MADALRALGVGIEDVAPEGDPLASVQDWLITPPNRLRGGADIDCGLAGTVMRFLPAVAALADGPVRLDGDAAARVRPMGPVIEVRETGFPRRGAGEPEATAESPRRIDPGDDPRG